jgi:hypothetical protein
MCLQVPSSCLADYSPCAAQYLEVLVPTRITAATPGVTWHMGTLRRRITLRANLTLACGQFMGVVSTTWPYMNWFVFANDASVTFEDTTLPLDCIAGDECEQLLHKVVRSDICTTAPHTSRLAGEVCTRRSAQTTRCLRAATARAVL